MGCAVLDGMHRVAAAFCASTALCPQSMMADTATLVAAFANSLRGTQADGSGMCVARGREFLDVNTQVSLKEWQLREGETFGEPFFSAMKAKSKKIQEFSCSGDKHAARSVISRIMSLYLEKLGQGPGYLFGPDQDSPMGRALIAGHVKNPSELQRRDRVRDFLRNDAQIPEEDVAEYLDDIEDWGKFYVNYFPRIYASFWLSALARHIKKVLAVFFNDNPGLKASWPGNQLTEFLSLTDEQWLDLFRFKASRGRRLGDVSLNFYARGATFLSTLSSTGDPLRPSSLQPTYYRGRNCHPRTLELLWISAWAHLSADILPVFRGVFSGTPDSAAQYPQEGACTTAHVQRMLTCIVQAVTSAVHSSEEIWKHALNMDSAGRTKNQSWHHAVPALDLQLLPVMVKDVVDTVNLLGVNPAYPEYLRLKNNSHMKAMDDAVGKATCVTNAMGTDLMWFLVTTFVAQLIHSSEARKGLKKGCKKDPPEEREKHCAAV